MTQIFAVIAAVIGLVVAFCLAAWIGKADEGTDRMKEIAGYIREGAMAFLAREYKTMVIVVVVLFLIIGFALQSWTTAVLYLCGAALSVLAGFFGMKVATLGNVRTANAEQGAEDRVQIRRCYGSLRIRSRSVRTGRGTVRVRPGNRSGMCHRLWSGCILHGAVWQSGRRYLHEGSRRWC